MRRHPLLAALAVLLLLLLGAGAAAGFVVHRDLEPVRSGRQHPVLFRVRRQETLDQVAAGLQARHLVRSGLVFRLFADAKGLAPHLEPGRFLIAPEMSPSEIVDVLRGPPLSQAFDVTIPDGLRASQEAALLQRDGLFPVSAYLSLVEGDRSFPGISRLPGTPSGAGWEGFAFGDTYQVLPSITPAQLLLRQLQDFQQRLSAAVDAGAARVGLTPYQVVVLASIVSAEVATPRDRGLVAGVFFNRLRLGMPLESDVTVLYAQSLAGDQSPQVDTKFASPYNTYLHLGLPPGPIDSPGVAAIEAVLHPTKTDYLYFLSLPDGKVEYSVTLAQHNAQIEEAGLG